MTHKLLGIPLIVWGLQLLYVAIALLIFVVLIKTLDNHASRLLIQILYVVVMLIINIAWRLAIRKLKPEWF